MSTIYIKRCAHTKLSKFSVDLLHYRTPTRNGLIIETGKMLAQIRASQTAILRAPVVKSFSRYLSASLVSLNAADARLKKKEKDQQKENKRKLKRSQLVKNRNKQAPELHPLYMDIPTALKYIRAAEVGNPITRTTISILMTIIPERGSKPLSGSVFFPRPLKDNKILVFSGSQDALDAAKSKGATRAGGHDLIEEIREGQLKLDDFSLSFATPDIIKDLKSIARLLGPRNLMPSEKKGTVSEDIGQIIEKNLGATPFKQKGQHLSIPVARCDFSDLEVIQNLKAASEAIYGCQPPGTKKPNIIGKTCLSSTIGPSIVIDFRN